MNPPSTNTQSIDPPTKTHEQLQSFTNKVKNNLICAICLHILHYCFILDCQHRLCSYCFIQHLKTSNFCPECRHLFKSVQKCVLAKNLCQDYLAVHPEEELTEEEKIKRAKPIKVKLVYPNGDIYKGDSKNGDKHGYGKLTLESGEIFDGFHLPMNYLLIFIGLFENDRRKKGKVIYPDGRSYDGSWRDNMYHGRGILKNGANYEYHGNFSNSKQHGLGKIIIRDENSTIKSITAQFIEGKNEDKGKIQYRDGGCYEGDFEQNSYLRDGFGEMKFPDASIYKGNWKDNKMHGTGEIHYLNGKIYFSSWLDGVDQPGGKMKYADGQEYFGFWKDDEFINGEKVSCMLMTQHKDIKRI